MNRLIIIAAAGENNALGLNNGLPWHLPDDFKRFKTLTSGHKIIMGRKTLDSFPKALPNREHIAITRDRTYQPKFPCIMVGSLEAAVALAKEDDTAFIIGGGEIYRQSMNVATHIELTRIHHSFEADAFFPEIDLKVWKLEQETYHPKDERHHFDFTYQTFVRQAL
ncbi:MAG: dihydrofolate reductase [Bacteroidota bacterium]